MKVTLYTPDYQTILFERESDTADQEALRFFYQSDVPSMPAVVDFCNSWKDRWTGMLMREGDTVKFYNHREFIKYITWPEITL